MQIADIDTNNFLLFYILCKYRYRFWKKKDIDEYQRLRRSKIVDYAVSNSVYFENRYQNKDCFYQLPTSNKSSMMTQFSDYNTLGLSKEKVLKFALEIEKNRDFSKKMDNLTIGLSSGTSGNKGLVVTTNKELQYLKAAYAARLILPKKVPIKAAFILRVSSPAFNYSKPWFSLHYINQLQIIEDMIAQLESIQPDILAAPPSMLQLLAGHKVQGQLNISPSIIYSYAEVLEDHIKQRIGEQFFATVHEIYQGSEGTYAMTCKYGNLHINEDLIYFEFLDQDNSPTKIGKPAYRTIITDLHKLSQPIIRYELNDIITIDPQQCPCGSSFRRIKSIQGRANDLLWGLRQEDNQPQFIYQDYIKRAIITASEDVIEYQVIQQDYDHINIKLEFTQSANKSEIIEKITSNIENIFYKYRCKLPKLRFEESSPELNQKSGKLIRVQSRIITYEK